MSALSRLSSGPSRILGNAEGYDLNGDRKRFLSSAKKFIVAWGSPCRSLLRDFVRARSGVSTGTVSAQFADLELDSI